jgi:hypothetical protein
VSQVEYDNVEHFVRVPVLLGGTDVRMLVDSGIGITIIDRATADSVGAVDLGTTMSGRRMSGQLVTAPLVRLPQLTIGGFTVTDHAAGVADLAAPERGAEFNGILGLDLFQEAVVTVDPGVRRLTLGEAVPEGAVIPLEVRREGLSITVFAQLCLPSGRIVSVEVDTGSGALILDDKYLVDCGISADDPRIEVREGADETGNRFVRRFVSLDGTVCLVGGAETAQGAPRAMFQKIIHDGLLGTDYLRRFSYSFDVARSRLVLGPATRAGRRGVSRTPA